MLHIAEERLHAYVDRDRSDIGPDEIARIEAHASTCDACRAVIEEGVMFRERANVILARSGPARVVAPEFAAIQARAAGELSPALAEVASRRPPRMRPGYVAMAWAASLLAALGLGWLTRDLFQERDQVAVEMTSETEEAAPFAASPVADAAGATALPATAGVDPVSPPAGAGSQAAVATARVGEARQSAAASAPAFQTVSPPVQPGDFAGVGVAGGTARGLTTARGAATDAPQRENAIAGQAESPARRATQDAAVSPPPAAPPAPARALQAAPAAPVRERATQAASAAPTREQGAGAASASAPTAPAPPPQASSARLAWVEMTRAAAESGFGARLLTIPDLPISRIALLGSGAGSMVRVWQVGPGGTEIALSQARQGAGLIQADVTRRVGEMMLMLEGALPPETLRELLGRAR